MRLFVRYVLLLLAFTGFALIIAAFLLVSLERPVIYQVQFINSENTASRPSYAQNDDKIEVLRPVYLDAQALSELAAPQKWLRMDKLESIVNSMTENQSNLKRVPFSENFDQKSSKWLSDKNPLSSTELLTNTSHHSKTVEAKSYAVDQLSTKYQQHSTKLDDILITVKTTKLYHQSRLKLIVETWFTKASNQTLIFSDAPFEGEAGSELDVSSVPKRVRVTDCPPSHQRQALCCKMSWELDAFLESSAKWWCHFDDDNYVNVAALLDTLSHYDHRENWYLGRPSIRNPLQILNRDDVTQHIVFWFATGGAGFCVSRSLALLMMPIAGGGKLISIGDKIRLPDDVTIGYVIEHLLKQKLTVVEHFHSHLENLELLDVDTLPQQISVSYALGESGGQDNVLSIGGLQRSRDPTRMLSFHCLLYPDTPFCLR